MNWDYVSSWLSTHFTELHFRYTIYKGMLLGIVTTYNDKEGRGTITVAGTSGKQYSFQYARGSNMMMLAYIPQPVLTYHHEQPGTSQLKIPRIGDPVTIEISRESQEVSAWGYVQHFVDLTERRYGRTFSPATEA